MNVLNEIVADQLRTDLPVIIPGDTVKVSAKVIEGNRERIQVFEGLVMRMRNAGDRVRDHRPPHRVGRRRRAHVQAPQPAHREDRGRPPRPGPPREAVLPAQPRRQGRHDAPRAPLAHPAGCYGPARRSRRPPARPGVVRFRARASRPAPGRAATAEGLAPRYRSTLPVTTLRDRPPVRDRAVRVLADLDTAGPADGRALGRDVGRGQPSRADQPAGDRGVEAAGHRVLDDRARPAARSRAPRAPRGSPPGSSPQDPEVEEHGARPDGEHRRRALEQHRHPAGAVVGPCASTMSPRCWPMEAAMRSRSSSSTGPERSSGRRREGEAVGPEAPDRDEPGRAQAWTMVVSSRGRPPAASQAWHVPSVGWPANGSSPSGVKMRTA